MEHAKRAYIKPRLEVYGDLRKLTLNANATNKDMPGDNDTAIPNTIS